MQNEGEAVRVRRWPLFVSIAATVGVMIVALALMLDLRANIEDRARENSENLLRAIERDIARNIEILDLSLQAVVDGVSRRDVMEADPEVRRQILFDRSGSASGVGAFIVFDAEGLITIESGSLVPRQIKPVLDRDYFQAQREADRGLFVSRPYVSRLIGKPVVGLSRRLSNADGSFAGVALATIEVAYFEKLLSRLHLGPKAVVSLIRTDGTFIVRHGSSTSAPAGDVSASPVFRRMMADSSGQFVGMSAVDGIERTYTFTQIEKRPLLLSIAQATDDIFADWRQRAILLGLVLAVICLIIVALTMVLTRELTRRAVAERDLGRLNTELARLSATDALTGLGNRRSFDESLARETRRAGRTGTKLSLVLLDVDHFKRFNDHYGHQEGDRILVAVAGAIRASCGRPGDGAFRIGGEEFAAILPDTDLPAALGLAERIRSAIRSLACPHADSPPGVVTASLGVTDIRGGDASSALAEADGALYASKRNGRDRATLAFEQRSAA
ncbi:diguanylate cyclase [uncultured Enterovirga sp.]|uniref:GGDEF domain-containing protein n=1 Tax=uncultured Enterovirga sp. TaxID=2026352 RepID=UPI0035CA1104